MFSSMKTAIAVSLYFVLFNVSGSVEKPKDILVLLEHPWIKETHSIFFSILADRGYKMTYQLADSPNLNLMKNGEYAYGTLLVMAPSIKEFRGKLDSSALVEFVDAGGNVVVTASSNIGEVVRKFGSECGVDFDDTNTAVIDHFNYDNTDEGLHTLMSIPSTNLINSEVMVGKVTSPILYRGVGMSTDANNPLLINVLHAPKSAYSSAYKSSISDYPNTVGTDTQLMVALQARNNARVLFIGSIDMLSDHFMTSSVNGVISGLKSQKSGNHEFIRNILSWLVGDRGSLRVVSVEHHRVKDHATPQQYRILDEVTYSIKIETLDETGKWVPFSTGDVQLELIRIDPFIRRTLSHADGKYSTIVKLPDVYGVFKFSVNYFRLGYTHITEIRQIAIRPFAHTEYERFIDAAYPYYSSAVSMLVGLVLFSFIFLYMKEDTKERSD